MRTTPTSQGVFCGALIRSLAPICPASHEGVPCQVISSSASPSCLRAVAHFNCLPRRSSRLTSGGTMSQPPRIRDGRAPGGRHHSIRRRLSRQAGQRRRPLGSMPGPLYSPGLIRLVNQGIGFSTAPSGAHALGRIPPQSDQKPPGHRHHHDLAHALSRATNALAKPNDLRRAGLVTLPEPGQLDHHGSQPPIAGLVYSLLTFRTPVLNGVGLSPA